MKAITLARAPYAHARTARTCANVHMHAMRACEHGSGTHRSAREVSSPTHKPLLCPSSMVLRCYGAGILICTVLIVNSLFEHHEGAKEMSKRSSFCVEKRQYEQEELSRRSHPPLLLNFSQRKSVFQKLHAPIHRTHNHGAHALRRARV